MLAAYNSQNNLFYFNAGINNYITNIATRSNINGKLWKIHKYHFNKVLTCCTPAPGELINAKKHSIIHHVVHFSVVLIIILITIPVLPYAVKQIPLVSASNRLGSVFNCLMQTNYSLAGTLWCKGGAISPIAWSISWSLSLHQ